MKIPVKVLTELTIEECRTIASAAQEGGLNVSDIATIEFIERVPYSVTVV